MSSRPAASSVAEPRTGPRAPHKETWIEQIASFVGFFIYLIILKSFFLPLFIIPTGSMAETLYGAHAPATCPNCGTAFEVNWQPPAPEMVANYQPLVQCPNCRWRQTAGRSADPGRQADSSFPRPLQSIAGDRIFVHGWTYDWPFKLLPGLGPQRWDVVVFKVPTDGQTNYIKRLIGQPGEKVEIIGGDVFINDALAAKTVDAQRSLWFPYFNQDYPPAKPAPQAQYYPRWLPLDPSGQWTGLSGRVLTYSGAAGGPATLQFTTDPHGTSPGVIQDVYAYNEPAFTAHAVGDVRLSSEVRFALSDQAWVELSTTRRDQAFYARLSAGGRLTLEHGPLDGTSRALWFETNLPARRGPRHLALAHVDGVVRVEVDGDAVYQTHPEQYPVTPEIARASADRESSPVLRITAGGGPVELQHVLIERDVYYTSNVDRRVETFGIQGRPIQLGPQDYFVLGDNSPNSADARYSFVVRPEQSAIGPHLVELAQHGDYHKGTVPADQMIGRAFFVYWPGALPLAPTQLNVLPDLGRARWIR